MRPTIQRRTSWAHDLEAGSHIHLAPPYALAYGWLAAVLGLAAGAVLWIIATFTLTLFQRPEADSSGQTRV
jgi:hypothetical protein